MGVRVRAVRDADRKARVRGRGRERHGCVHPHERAGLECTGCERARTASEIAATMPGKRSQASARFSGRRATSAEPAVARFPRRRDQCRAAGATRVQAPGYWGQTRRTTVRMSTGWRRASASRKFSISHRRQRRTHSPSRVIMAKKEQAWETKVARKTRKKASNSR